jgi:hypothetical protein
MDFDCSIEWLSQNDSSRKCPICRQLVTKIQHVSKTSEDLQELDIQVYFGQNGPGSSSRSVILPRPSDGTPAPPRLTDVQVDRRLRQVRILQLAEQRRRDARAEQWWQDAQAGQRGRDIRAEQMRRLPLQRGLVPDCSRTNITDLLPSSTRRPTGKGRPHPRLSNPRSHPGVFPSGRPTQRPPMPFSRPNQGGSLRPTYNESRQGI